MKNIIRLALLVAVVFSFNSCSTDDRVIDGVFDNVSNGAVLRTTAIFSNELPIGDASAQFSIEIEEQDAEEGALLESVDVLISFTDGSPDTGDSSGAASGEVTYASIGASEFSPGPFGLPRTTLTITLNDFLNAVGLGPDDIFGGDVFRTRLVLNLTDGRSFTNTNTAGVVTGGFFNSPFVYNTPVVCPVEDGFFTGTYLVTQNAPSIFGFDTFDPDGGGVLLTLYDAEGAASASLAQPAEAETLSSTQRIFDADYLAALGFGNTRSYILDFVCSSVLVPTGQSTGLTCGGPGITLGPPTGDPGMYDFTDDSVFDMIFTDDELDDCGGGVQASLTWTKQ